MILQVDNLGNQSKASVCAPENLGVEKPNLVFKVPTYNFRDSSLLATRQGGSRYWILRLFLFFSALTAIPIRKFFSNGVKILRVRTTIDMLFKLCKPLTNPLTYFIPPRITTFGGYYERVCFIHLKTPLKLSVPPE